MSETSTRNKRIHNNYQHRKTPRTVAIFPQRMEGGVVLRTKRPTIITITWLSASRNNKLKELRKANFADKCEFRHPELRDGSSSGGEGCSPGYACAGRVGQVPGLRCARLRAHFALQMSIPLGQRLWSLQRNSSSRQRLVNFTDLFLKRCYILTISSLQSWWVLLLFQPLSSTTWSKQHMSRKCCCK